MNNLVKSVFRISSLKSLANPLQKSLGRRDFTRTFWHMSKRPEPFANVSSSIALHKPSLSCSCGCGQHHMHTKGEKELVEFLTEEILAEKKAQKTQAIPNELEGFKIKYDNADVELVKQNDKEKIVVSFNVNHTVDTEDDGETVEETSDNNQLGEMKSKPNFEVDIIRGKQTLSFTCSFLQGAPAEGEYNDVFGIDEVTLYEGEWVEKNYAVAGDVLDGYLYDLLMNLLEEKGISNDFVEKLGNLSTNYEHSSYIRLLESLSQFTITGK